MKKQKKSILVLAMISCFTITTLFFLGLSEVGGGKPEKPEMIMLNEIYDIVLDTNIRIGVPAPVEKTGQTTSYATRDDGDLEKGIAWPVPRFTDNGDGTVTDNLTGLIWLKNGTCFPGGGPSGATPWQSALDACNNLQNLECGLSDGSSPGDWRLPNVKELHSLIDFGNYHPALPTGHPFTVADTYYWTSTTVADTPLTLAFRIDLDSGNIGSGTKVSPDGLVLPVRGGN